MKPERALQIIFTVWGSNGVINALEVAEADAAALPGETTLATLTRIAGIDLSDIVPFNPNAWQVIRARIAVREVELATAFSPRGPRGKS